MQRYSITVHDVLEVEQLLSSINWLNIDNDTKDMFFERIRNTIKYLNREERELFYSLLENFINISTSMFDSKLRTLVTALTSMLTGIDNIFIVPVVDEESSLSFDLKSGQYIAFLLKSLINENKQFKNKKINFISSPAGLENHKNRMNSLIVFCDDFIGTGKQFNKTMHFYNNYSLITDKCVLVTLAILRKGYDAITAKGYPVFSDMICEKGISSNPNILDKKKTIHVMTQIEKGLKVNRKFLFGYKKSEGLIAIRQRSPNNTFPLFWWNRSPLDEAVFQR